MNAVLLDGLGLQCRLLPVQPSRHSKATKRNFGSVRGSNIKSETELSALEKYGTPKYLTGFKKNPYNSHS